MISALLFMISLGQNTSFADSEVSFSTHYQCQTVKDLGPQLQISIREDNNAQGELLGAEAEVTSASSAQPKVYQLQVSRKLIQQSPQRWLTTWAGEEFSLEAVMTAEDARRIFNATYTGALAEAPVKMVCEF